MESNHFFFLMLAKDFLRLAFLFGSSVQTHALIQITQQRPSACSAEDERKESTKEGKSVR